MIKKSVDITAFGELLIDFTDSGVNEFGQTIFTQNPGGAPANVLVAAQKLGCQTAFLGKVGNDMHGKFLKNTLLAQNINIDGLISDKNFFTTLAFVKINEKTGEREFSFSRKLGADTQMTKDEINLNILKNSKILHIGSLSLTNEPSKSTTYYLLELAKKFGCKISYDPNYRAALWKSEKTAKKYMRSIIPYVDYMKISEEETELITDKKSPNEAAKILFNKGVKIIVVTLGEKGAFLYSKFGEKYINGFSSKAVDTTGAGDSFWGAFLSCLASNNSPKDIDLINYVNFANATASLCVERYGAIPAMPDLEEVNKRLKEL